MKHPLLTAAFAASAAIGLSGCVTDGYGYSGVSLGYGDGYYGDRYYGNGYYGAGYYGDPYWGWYNDFYYPGAGYYIYDRGGRRHRWNDGQRAYWEGRRGNRPGRENWTDYRSGSGAVTGQNWQQRREAWRAQRQQQGGTATQQPQAQAQSRESYRAQNQTSTQGGDTSGWRGRGNWGGGGGGGWGGGNRGGGGRHRGN